ncbi:hypothetical protein O181_006974 [Austropuccinia psidii MF-1]|uniref:Reverse transcriptase Ty1/copia-type domain-containing protein n=1 Tax=Austropuccinia psidii MF-1 TaxID=1389203 RepID=A0A9Q3GHE8_9BASI|nr:hypothetical protein [Austropuccinia psidii MF-1]
MNIQPVFSLTKIVPFGVKVLIKKEYPASKINPTGQAMKALTFKPYSDALRVLDTVTGKIKVSWDYAQLKSETLVILRKNPSLLPISKNQVNVPTIPLPTLTMSNSPIIQVSDSSTNKDNQMVNPAGLSESSRGYTYVPYYDKAPQNVSSRISTGNMIEGSQRNRHPPERLLLANVLTYSQELSDPTEEQAWRTAMKHEFDSLTTHNTGELIPYPNDGSKVIGGVWILTRKKNKFGEFYCHKARWVVLGNHQEHMLHYYDTWASVGRNETFKVMLVMVVNKGFISYQFDIETDFLHGEMDANVYVKQVKSFEVPGREGWVWKLDKSLYGTKQAPWMWQMKLAKVLSNLGLFCSRSYDSLYVNEGKTLFLHVHVDDGFIISESDKETVNFLKNLNGILKLKSQKNPSQHLGYRLKWLPDGNFQLSQQDLISQLLRTHEVENSQGVETPCNGNFLKELEYIGEVIMLMEYQQAIGTLNYIAQHTCPDISYTVNSLSRYGTHPNNKHWAALKHLLCYLKSTLSLSLLFSQHCSSDLTGLVGWADADYAND